MAPSRCGANLAQAKNWWHAPSTTSAHATRGRSLPSTVAPFPSTCWKPNSSVIAKGLHRVHRKTERASFQTARSGTLFSRRNRRPALVNAVQVAARHPRACGTRRGCHRRSPCRCPHRQCHPQDLAAARQQGTFRQDLYYRLNVIQIAAAIEGALVRPAGPGAGVCLKKSPTSLTPEAVPELSAAALYALSLHPFPGNVRELENLLQRAVALSNQQLIEPDDLGLSAAGCMPPPDNRPPPPGISPQPPETTPCAAELPPDLACHPTPSNETFWFAPWKSIS